MRLFLYRVVWFLLPIAFIAYPMDVLISGFLAKNGGDEIQVWNELYHGHIDARIAIYGSSRAVVQIDSEILQNQLGQSAYNFGINGHNFWLQYLRNIEFQKHNPPPEIIIHSLDIFTMQKRPDLGGIRQFLPYMLWNTNMYNYTHSYVGFTKADYLIPMLRYAKRGNDIAIGLFDAKRDKGYRGIKGKWNTDLDDAMAKRDYFEASFDSATLELYDQFLSECHDSNIQILLVYTPEYIGGQKFVINRDKVISTFHDYAKKYNLHFLDYSTDPICFDKQYFYNALHLNQKGAEIFTTKLAEDLKKILLENSVSD